MKRVHNYDSAAANAAAARQEQACPGQFPQGGSPITPPDSPSPEPMAGGVTKKRRSSDRGSDVYAAEGVAMKRTRSSMSKPIKAQMSELHNGLAFVEPTFEEVRNQKIWMTRYEQDAAEYMQQFMDPNYFQNDFPNGMDMGKDIHSVTSNAIMPEMIRY